MSLRLVVAGVSSHFASMKLQSKKGPQMCLLVHQSMSGTVQGAGDAVRNKTHESSTLRELTVR